MASLSDAFKEGFAMPANHTELINTSQQKYNKFLNTNPGINNKLGLLDDSNVRINDAIVTPGVNYASRGYFTGASVDRMQGKIDYNTNNALLQQVKLCERKTLNDNNPATYTKCGICMKVGTNHKGTPHIGGLYRGDKDDKHPYAGSCPDGYFATNEAEYDQIKRRMDCAEKHDFSIRGCSQCLLDENKSTLIDDESLQNPILGIKGTGKITISIGNTLYDLPLNGETKEFELNNYKEGAGFIINAKKIGDKYPEIAAYLKGPGGDYKLDLARVISIDLQSGTKPRFKRQIEEGGALLTVMGPGSGKEIMSLSFNIPVTFISSGACAGNIAITKEESANELNSSPCFNKQSGPGNYSGECLQQLYASSGCDSNGKMSPAKAEGRELLLKDENGQPRNVSQIVNYMNNAYTVAATGKDLDGQQLSAVKDGAWDKASQLCFGKTITTPCDIPGPGGKASDTCITYLYQDTKTYDNKNAVSQKNGKEAYCTATLTQDTINKARTSGAGTPVDAKTYFNNIHAQSFNASLAQNVRDQYVQQCYGLNAITDDLPPNIGVKARYLRITRAPDSKVEQHIQISRLEVIDRTSKDVALKRPTSAATEWNGLPKDRPVNGNDRYGLYWNMYHDDPKTDAKTIEQFWEVDLGEEKDICFINYFNRVDCCQERSKGMRIKLLNSNRELKTEYIVDYGLIQSFNCLQGNYAYDPEIIRKVLMGYNNAISLTQTDSLGKKYFLSYMQQYSGYMPNEKDEGYNNLTDINASIVPASFRIAYQNNAKNEATLVPTGKPNSSINIASDNTLLADTRGFASFRFTRVAGKQGIITIKSVKNPNLYVATNFTSRDKIYLIDPTKQAGYNIEWKVEMPFQQNTAGPEVYLSAYRRYDFDRARAEQKCISQGGQLATMSQLEQAQKEGGQWCNWGHVSDSNKIGYIMQEPKCGNGPNSVTSGTTANVRNGRADATCFGPKPSPDFISAVPWTNIVNGPIKKPDGTTLRMKWSKYD